MQWMEPAQTISRTVGRTSPPATGQPHVFLTLRCDRPLEPGARFCLEGADVVTIARSDSLSMERREEDGVAVMRIGIPDPRLSSMHARLQSVLGNWVVQDAGSKNGTWVDGRRVTSIPLADGALVEVGHSFLLYREALPARGPAFVDARELRPPAERLATLSPALEAQLDRLVLVARSRVSILVRGETGTGKEVIASAIHQLSARPGRFVAVNCGALAENLVESELFGYRKGAFSGATEDRPGLVRSSDQGTLLLDEIGDLPLSAQAALLRVLQEAEVLAVGATQPVKVDLRVVASTHRDLDALVGEERFRADLLARLSGFSLSLPPLRERREDLGLLVAELLRKLAGEGASDVTFTPEAARALLLHRWPLNVRELENCLASAIVLASNGVVGLEELPASIRDMGQSTARTTPSPPRLSKQEEERRRHDELVDLLRKYDGNVTAVARAMDKPRTQVQRWLRRLHVDPLSFRR
jgi:sigma-54 dependent transcriptional regulator, acetoin dehydrogenase operon transcriptional activator AcoR